MGCGGGVGWLGGPEAGATGAEPRETGRCASASARTVAGVSASREACLVFVLLTQSAANPGERRAHIPTPAALNQLTSELPGGTASQR